MSDQIPVAFAQKFRGDFIMLSQQRGSRLRSRVREDADRLDGKAGYFERIGATAMQQMTTRHDDTPLVDTPHSRRRIILKDYNWADLIDRKDVARMIAGGTLPQRYLENALFAAGRQMDDLIIAAALGNAVSMDSSDAASNVALPSGQKVVHGSAGLTVAKLRDARRILLANEAIDEMNPNDELTIVVTAQQLDDLLGTTEVTSADFNSVKALVAGNVDTFMGFKFVRSQRLTTDSNGHRQVIAFARSGIGLAVGGGEDIFVDIGPRRDKNNSIQVYVEFSADATRIEDEKVVEIACVES